MTFLNDILLILTCVYVCVCFYKCTIKEKLCLIEWDEVSSKSTPLKKSNKKKCSWQLPLNVHHHHHRNDPISVTIYS